MNPIPFPSRHAVLHERAVNASKKYHLAVGELMEALALVEQNSVYLHYGCSSLFAYGVKYLNLSESVAYEMIGVLRKSKEVPALMEEVLKGELTISKAMRIVSVINPDNQEAWIEKGKTLTSRELEKEVVTEKPELKEVREQARFVSKERLKLTLGISEETLMELKRAQDLVSRFKSKGASLEETLEEAIQFYLKHKDPLQKADRNESRKNHSNSNQESRFANAPPTLHVQSFRTNKVRNQNLELESIEKKVMGNHRNPIPAQIKHEVNQRDQGKCQFKGLDGNKCESSRWTDLHHIKPVQEGGVNTTQNLITLCKAHHRSIYPRWK